MAESELARCPSLHDRAVVVTGGASGIGASIVTHFADQGARVGFIDFDADAGRALMTQLGPNAARCLFVDADLRDIARRAAHDERRSRGHRAGRRHANPER